MAAHVPDGMIDECAVAGTAARCQEQLGRWEGLLDMAMFFPPGFGVPRARVMENQLAILRTSGR